MPDEYQSNAASLTLIASVLSRETSIGALTALAEAIRLDLPAAALAQTVIAFDANVFLRLSTHRRSEDIIDYLRTDFEGHIVLPGQVIQEFWNNQFIVVDSVAFAARKKADELRLLIEKIDARYGKYSEQLNSLLDEFREEFGYVFEEQTLRRTSLFLNLLQEKALVSYVPRPDFAASAQIRKRTKTPPGFKDDLDGDFFVWADLLLGLAILKAQEKPFERVSLVTLDKKLDWSREGIPHPVLTAEIAAVCGATFEILTIDGLAHRLLD